MKMFVENDSPVMMEKTLFFDLNELKEHLKTLPPDERTSVTDLERLRKTWRMEDTNTKDLMKLIW